MARLRDSWPLTLTASTQKGNLARVIYSETVSVPAAYIIPNEYVDKLATVVIKKDGSYEFTSHPGATKFGVIWRPETAMLIPVLNKKFKQTFDPPTTHLGQKILDTSPLGIGELALSYYSGLIDEAQKLSHKSFILGQFTRR